MNRTQITLPKTFSSDAKLEDWELSVERTGLQCIHQLALYSSRCQEGVTWERIPMRSYQNMEVAMNSAQEDSQPPKEVVRRI